MKRTNKGGDDDQTGCMHLYTLRYAAAIAALAMLGGCDRDQGLTWSCQSERVEQKTSGDGGVVVAVWARDCGATTPVATHIQASEPDEDGAIRYEAENVFFIAGFYPDGQNIEIEFGSSGEIIVFYNDRYGHTYQMDETATFGSHAIPVEYVHVR